MIDLYSWSSREVPFISLSLQEPKAKSMYEAALVTPPKDQKEQTLIAANHVPDNSVAPFTPIQNTSECGGQQQDNIEPLPYHCNIFEGSPFSPNANGHLLQLVYSPLQANPHPQSTLKSDVDKQEFDGDQPPPLGAPANLPDEKMPPLPRSEHKKHYAKKPPLPPSVHQPHQWHAGVYPPPPPPPYYWGYYHHGYHHHHYGTQGDARASHNPRVSHPTLYPKPQYHPPAAAHQEYITEVTNNDVICGRGGAVNNHAGNRRFRKLINEFKHQYLNEVKQRKPAVAMRVLEAVKPGRYEQ